MTRSCLIDTYLPPKLPFKLNLSRAARDLLKKAHQELTDYDQLLRRIPYPDDVLYLLALQEAIASAKPYKAKAALETVLVSSLLEQQSVYDPIFRYMQAYEMGSKHIYKKPFSKRLFCDMHRCIKENTVLKHHSYRTKQNWIGPQGCSIDQAYFFPPAPQKVSSLMNNLISYSNTIEHDPLLQLALILGQMLIIHPFMDGNGRAARLIIPLFLYKSKAICAPYFFLSAYFRKHRMGYLTHLFSISYEGNWEKWILYFLKGVSEQARLDYHKVKQLLHLWESLNRRLQNTLSRRDSEKALRFLFRSPVCIPSQLPFFQHLRNIIHIKKKRE